MSLFSGSNISELFVGENKIGSVFVGENCVYQSKYEIPIEEDNGNEYFYFRVHDKKETAQVGFERRTHEYHPSAATTIPEINYSSFPTYVTPTFEYSYDKVTWNPYTLGTLLSIGNGQVADKVYFRGDNLAPWYDEYQQTTTHTDSNNNEVTDTHDFHVGTHAIINNAKVQCNGNIMSLRYKNYQNQLTIPCEYAFPFLFASCTNLLRGPVLTATTLAIYCYARLFAGCSNLSLAPNLLATTMQEGCYASMFTNCTALKTGPQLPATTLAKGCYGSIPDVTLMLKGYSGKDPTTWIMLDGMFSGCTSLTTAPELPATTLTDYCYMGMFRRCYSLTTAPTLPATTLASYCYFNMFSYCNSLTTAPTLPATTLASYCYYGMFSYCDSLTTAPALPATTLANYCYQQMFSQCKSLINAPILSATTLASYCYSGMFSKCVSLENAPNLPATTLAEYCYGTAETYIVDGGMFSGCTALKKPPLISATKLAKGCFNGMFAEAGITETPPLKYTTLATDCYGGWFAVGMFQGCKSLTKISTLPATAIKDYGDVYYSMFADSNVKASATQTTECKYAFRIPSSGTGDAESKDLTNMFTDASDTTKNFTPSVNTTFYINVPSF